MGHSTKSYSDDLRRLVNVGDWLLTFKLDKNKVSSLDWMMVDGMIHVPASDKECEKDYPFTAIQVYEHKNLLPPFDETDKEFKAAFSKAVLKRKESIEQANSLDPTKSFLDEVYKRLART